MPCALGELKTNYKHKVLQELRLEIIKTLGLPTLKIDI